MNLGRSNPETCQVVAIHEHLVIVVTNLYHAYSRLKVMIIPDNKTYFHSIYFVDVLYL